ncbi:MAG: glycosyltransferase family 4 protein [Rhizomicrobium sp.]
MLKKNVLEVITFTTLYPNAAAPNHGIFVENRLLHLVDSGMVRSRVVAPVPWFPSSAAMFGKYSSFGKAPLRESRNGLEVYHPRFLSIPKVGMSAAPQLLCRGSAGTMRRLEREKSFDLIDAHYFYPDGVAAIRHGQALGKPVVITARGTDVNLIPQYRLPRLQLQGAAAEAAAIVTVSQALKDAVVDLGVPPDRVTVLRNGVDLDLFHPAGRNEARQKLSLGRRTLVSVGHLVERKGNHLVIEALAGLPGFELLIAGDGPERARLESQAMGLGVRGRIRFLGAIPHRELQQLYVAADALVLASSREGWPNVLLEAMACGTPVIASNIWGNPEVVSRPEAGTLMRERTAAGAAEGIRALFSNYPDRAKTRHYAEQFSWDATTAGQIHLFRKILEMKSAGDSASTAAAL